MDNKLPATQKYWNMVKKMSPSDASPEDLNLLYYIANDWNLDPAKKEIYLIKYGGKVTIMASRDGYLKIANNHPQFNGMESDTIYEGDIITKKENGAYSIQYGTNHLNFDKKLIRGAYCNVYRKDRDICISMIASFRDYNKGSNIWAQYPDAMIIKVAESMALKRAFALNGLVTQEELGVEPPKSNTIDADIDEEENED